MTRPPAAFSPAASHTSAVTPLEDRSPAAFRAAVASLLRALGYADVTVAATGPDDASDISMRDGDTAYLVACEHADVVSRPAVQRLQWAVETADHPGPTRGMVVTAGRFSPSATACADAPAADDGPPPIDLVDGDALREMADDAGIDLEAAVSPVACERTLPVGDPELAIAEAFEAVANAPPRSELPAPETRVTYRPHVDVEAVTRASLEAGTGEPRRIDSRDRLVFEAGGEEPRPAPADLLDLVGGDPVDLSGERSDHPGDVRAFGATRVAYREAATEHLLETHATTVTDGNGRGPDERELRPDPDDVEFHRLDPLYVPRVRATVELGEYRHGLAYDAAGPRRALREDRIRRCVHCEAGRGAAADATVDRSAAYTYCDNCGSVSCEDHMRTERLTGEPVCTGCAVTDEVWYDTKYFFDEDDRAAFREAYAAMPLYRKPLENPPVAAALAAGLLLVVALLAAAVLAF